MGEIHEYDAPLHRNIRVDPGLWRQLEWIASVKKKTLRACIEAAFHAWCEHETAKIEHEREKSAAVAGVAREGG